MKKFVVLLVSLTTVVSYGATEENIIVKKRPVVVVENSSVYNRMDKTFQATGQVLGFNVSPAIGQGLNFGYYLGRNSVIQLEASQGTYDGYSFNMDAQVFGVHFKQHFGGTFYLNAGLDNRKIAVTSQGILNDGVDGEKLGDVQSVVASLAVGNQWQFETFTLGCDWFGISQPIDSSKENVDYSKFSASDREEVKELWEELGQTMSAQILRFYLGASF